MVNAREWIYLGGPTVGEHWLRLGFMLGTHWLLPTEGPVDLVRLKSMPRGENI